MEHDKNYSKIILLVLIASLLVACDDDYASIEEAEEGVTLNSEEQLSEYLAGSTYLSTSDQEVGLGEEGEIYGKWSITFGIETFDWHYSDVIEQGTYSYLGQDTMLVIVGNTSFSSTIDTSTIELEWNGLTYARKDD